MMGDIRTAWVYQLWGYTDGVGVSTVGDIRTAWVYQWWGIYGRRWCINGGAWGYTDISFFHLSTPCVSSLIIYSNYTYTKRHEATKKQNVHVEPPYYCMNGIIPIPTVYDTLCASLRCT